MNTPDVIIVGAGPGGSTAAAALARHGIKTLIVDRGEFPRDKTCGDAIPADCFHLLGELGLNLSDEPGFHWVDQMQVRVAGQSCTVKFSEEGNCIAPRYIFDHKILTHALACGAAFEQMNVTGLVFADDQVVGVEGKQGKQTVQRHAKIVIAADGATSAIARALGSPSSDESHRGVAIRGYVDACVDLDTTLDFDFMDEIPSGYAWFFPVGKRIANVGLGVSVRDYKKNSISLEDILQIYLNRPSVRSRVIADSLRNVKRWSLPTFSPTLKRVFNGAMLVGDAAGFVSPLTGDGIYTAMASGKAAAETAIHALSIGKTSEEALSTYDNAWKSVFGERLDLETKFKKLMALSAALPLALLCNDNMSHPESLREADFRD